MGKISTFIRRGGAQRPEHLETCCFDQNAPKELLFDRKLIAPEKSVPKKFQDPMKFTLMHSYGKIFLVGQFCSETVLKDQST